MGGDRKENFRYQPLYKKNASQRRHHDLFCKKKFTFRLQYTTTTENKESWHFLFLRFINGKGLSFFNKV